MYARWNSGLDLGWQWYIVDDDELKTPPFLQGF